MVFHSSLSDSKSPQVSRTLLSILADLNNAIDALILMGSTRPFISKSSNPFTSSLGTVSSTPITVGITVSILGTSGFF